MMNVLAAKGFPNALRGMALALAALSIPSIAQAADRVDAASAVAAPATGSSSFRSLFQSWKRQDGGKVNSAVSIPSAKPVTGVAFTSGFGVRSDPFRGGAAMHAGVDLAGPVGTAIYATADGIVDRAKWANGYGNLVELNHGGGIQTRYGHLSQILVTAGQRVKRGQLIAKMGSTGRSTGSHLHYEVRLDGHAVSPLPYLKTADYVTKMARRGDDGQVALGGPEDDRTDASAD